jgi:hypothetical protein
MEQMTFSLTDSVTAGNMAFLCRPEFLEFSLGGSGWGCKAELKKKQNSESFSNGACNMLSYALTSLIFTTP